MRKARYSILLLVASALLLVSGCSRKYTSDFEETTAVETTEDEHRFDVNIPLNLEEGTKATKEVVETIEGGGEIGLSSDGTMTYNMGKFGDLGENTYNQIVSRWQSGDIKDENELRGIMDAIYENLSTKEELVQDILATSRSTQTNEAESQYMIAKETVVQSGAEKSSTTLTQIQETASAPTPEQQAEIDAKLKEWEENQPEVKAITGAGRMDWDPDEAVGQWTWN